MEEGSADQQLADYSKYYIFTFIRSLILFEVFLLIIFALVGTSQILLCTHLINGSPSLILATLPLLFALLFAILHFILIKSHPTTSGIGFILLFLSILSLILHFTLGETSWPWWAALLCSWGLEIHLLAFGLLFFIRAIGKRYEIKPQMGFSLFLYFLMLLFFIWAEVQLILHEVTNEDEGETSPPHPPPSSSHPSRSSHPRGLHPFMDSPYFEFFLFYLGLLTGVAGFSLYLYQEAKRIGYTKGYTPPLPLNRTEQGWGPGGSHADYWMLLGEAIERNVDLSEPRLRVDMKQSLDWKDLLEAGESGGGWQGYHPEDLHHHHYYIHRDPYPWMSESEDGMGREERGKERGRGEGGETQGKERKKEKDHSEEKGKKKKRRRKRSKGTAREGISGQNEGSEGRGEKEEMRKRGKDIGW